MQQCHQGGQDRTASHQCRGVLGGGLLLDRATGRSNTGWEQQLRSKDVIERLGLIAVVQLLGQQRDVARDAAKGLAADSLQALFFLVFPLYVL
ncbi:hypothetical protein NL676_030080 [Syzygium grande]|nr:hypothetical protein NL676_030080 [Syzygium grande]